MIGHIVTSLHGAGYRNIAAIIPNNLQLRQAIGNEVQIIENSHPELGMGHSISLAARHALKMNSRTLLITLGDMPFVSAEHIRSLMPKLAKHDVVISGDDKKYSPPILISKLAIPEFTRLKGDVGGKRLIQAFNWTQSLTLPEELRDIDQPEDLP